MKFFERSFEHTDHPEQQAFEIAFTEELISAEQLRFYLMTAFFIAAPVVFFVLSIILPDIYFRVFGDSEIWLWMTVFGVVGVIYSFLVRWRVVGLIKQGKNNWKWIRYFNTLEEMMISTLAIYMMSLAVGPIQALVSPVTEIYYLFILLSCLRLDSKICLFAGATAMINYLFICWYLLRAPTIDPDLLGFIAEPLYYFYRSLFILSAGCAAAFVTYRYRDVIDRAMVSQQKTIEVERDRIMRDLHDDVASNLLTLNHQAESPRSRQLASDALKNLREIIYSLDTNSQKKLVDLLLSWRDEMEERLLSAHIEFRWHQQEEVAAVSMSPRKLLNLGRALREIASNVIKHAEPQNLYVQWYLRDEKLVLCVTDDGHHLPIDQWQEGKGLCNIKRRASELEGDVQWRLTNDGSKELCQVELLVPIAQE
jgi:signal transduction histidine kinase